MTVRNEEMQSIINAQAELAEEFLEMWSEAESDLDTGKTPDWIKRHFSQRDWPLDAVFRDHELWVLTGGKEGVQANFQGCDLLVLAVCNDLEEHDNFLVPYITFDGRSLEGAIFAGAQLHHVYFRGADLTGADFLGAELDSVSFRMADLTGARFSGASLYYVIFWHAKLEGTDFRNAYYEELELTGANAVGVLLDDPDPDNEEETERHMVLFEDHGRHITKISQSLFTHLIQFMPLEDLAGVNIV